MNRLTICVASGLLVAGLAGCSIEPAAVASPVSRPGIDDPPGMSCVSNYPERLDAFPVAFAGTVVDQKDGKFKPGTDPEKKIKPIEITFEVDTAYRGVTTKRITLHTFDLTALNPTEDHIGKKALVAAEESLDLQYCGYTRPYSEQDAAYWASTFE